MNILLCTDELPVPDFDLSKLSPFELGETSDLRAVPYLIPSLYHGAPSQRRLAASAIGKLAHKHHKACAFAAGALLDCLNDPVPQVRQYDLKPLAAVPLPQEAATLLARIRDEDERLYNRDEAASLLYRYFPAPGSQGQMPLPAQASTTPVTSPKSAGGESAAAEPDLLALFDPAASRVARVAARAMVADLPGQLSRSAVAKLLTGSPSKRIARQWDHPAHGVCARSDVQLLTFIVDAMLAAGELALDKRSRLIYIEAPAQQPASQ